MAINKVIYKGETVIDISTDTVDKDAVKEGVTFHGPDGEARIGTHACGNASGDTFTFNVSEVLPLTTLTFNYDILYNAYKCLVSCSVIGAGNQAVVVFDGKPYCDFSRNQIVPLMNSSGEIDSNSTMSNVLGNTAIATEHVHLGDYYAAFEYVRTLHPYYMGGASNGTKYEIIVPYDENLGTSATPTHTVQIFRVIQ